MIIMEKALCVNYNRTYVSTFSDMLMKKGVAFLAEPAIIAFVTNE